jgi:hypothetical protein
MERTSTQNLILLYAYNELDGPEKLSFEIRLVNEPDLQLKLQEVLELQGKLDSINIEPNETSVQIVLEESLNSHLETY